MALIFILPREEGSGVADFCRLLDNGLFTENRKKVLLNNKKCLLALICVYNMCILYFGNRYTMKKIQYSTIRVNFYMDSTWYSQLPVTRTSCSLEAILISFQIDFYIISPSITQTHDNSNFFLFPLRVRINGNRLYTQGVQ